MPSYDYHCPANGQTVEVRHSMNDKFATWGEVCAQSGMDVGSTPADSPVQKLISGGQFVRSNALKNPEAPSCASGGCAGGMCGL